MILGGKGEGAAGIFEAWDVNYDGKITVEEVRRTAIEDQLICLFLL